MPICIGVCRIDPATVSQCHWCIGVADWEITSAGEPGKVNRACCIHKDAAVLDFFPVAFRKSGLLRRADG